MTQAEVVVVEVPADPSYVVVLRTVTAALAGRADFTLDEIEDLRIVVDEAATLLLKRAMRPSTIRCEISPGDADIRLSLTARLAPEATLPQEGFAWTVLSALTDEAVTHVDGAVTQIEVLRRRGWVVDDSA